LSGSHENIGMAEGFGGFATEMLEWRGFWRFLLNPFESHQVSVGSHQVSVQSQLEMVVVATQSQLSHFSRYFFS
jgi:hypothetical protein